MNIRLYRRNHSRTLFIYKKFSRLKIPNVKIMNQLNIRVLCPVHCSG